MTIWLIMLLTMVPQWANNPADRIRRWSSEYPLTKFYKAGGISPTTFRRCTSSSFLDREEHAETSGFIFNSWAFFTPPQQVVWGGVFQWLNPQDRVFSMENDHGNWGNSKVPWSHDGLPRLRRMVISLPKSSPGPFFGLFLSRNCRNPNLFMWVCRKMGQLRLQFLA